MSRYYLAWRSRQEDKRAREGYHAKKKMQARLREFFDPVEDLPEAEFRRHYRLSKEAFVFLCEELRLRTDLRPSQRVSLEFKVLTALLFYATGSYQRPVGIAKNTCQSACSGYIEEVTQALIHPGIMAKHIVFPQTQVARRSISQKFYTKYGIPGTIGCIDCTHIKIVKPVAAEEHIYFSRKNCHSMNVQMICDSDHRILNVNPKYGGANHDAFVWGNSQVNNYMQQLQRNNEMVWLLGDSGYPQRPWLMTPYQNVANSVIESAFNRKHMTARVTIENAFGRLKNRWRCLCKDRVLHYTPVKCAQIIEACCVLYNIALSFGVPEPEEDLGQNSEDAAEEVYIESRSERNMDLIRGRVLRNQLARRIYSEQV